VTYQKYDSRGSPLALTAVNPNVATGCGGGPCFFPLLFPGVYALFAQQNTLGVRTVIPQGVDGTSHGTNLSADNITRIDVSDTLRFRNILGFDDATNVLTNDTSGTASPLVNAVFLPWSVTTRQFTEEAQFLGKSFDKRLDWIVGGFYLDSYSPPRSLPRISSD